MTSLSTQRGPRSRLWAGPAVALLAATLCLTAAPALAYESVTARKTIFVVGRPAQVTRAQFTISYAQEIKWGSTLTGSSTAAGDAFYLHTDTSNLREIALSTSLDWQYDSGTHRLDPGTYHISITDGGMGEGIYTIEYNPTMSIGVSPTSYTFGPFYPGEQSTPETFTISATGDLPVRITSVVSDDPAHFVVSNAPTNEVVPPNRTFRVRYQAGSTPGSYGANITISGQPENGIGTVSPASVSVSGETKPPPEPDIDCAGGSCPSANYLGQADHTIGQVKVFSYSFENDGGADLVFAAPVTLVNGSPLAPFSLASTPSTAPLNAGESRSASIRFQPPASGGEATYCGHLVIQTNDPDEPYKECYFEARAHHPEPRMYVSPVEVDYGEVELGFAFERRFTVTNSGDATLHLTVVDNTPPSLVQNLDHWSDLDASTSIEMAVNANGGSRDFPFRYEPRDLSGPSGHEVHVQVAGDDPTNLSEDVTLRGEAIPPIPIDAVLLLDRSRSMASSAGQRTKILALRTAASLFTHLLRPSIPNTGMGDRIGFVRYNDVNDVYLGLGQVSDAGHMTTADDRLSDDALTDAEDGIKPHGTTCIGGAMETGAGMLTVPADDRKHVMVVLTDGIEIKPPWIADVSPEIIQNDPDLRIYSVGVGDEHESDALQSITNVTNGYHQVVGALEHGELYDLELFYFKIFANATELQIVADPTVPVPLSGTAPVTVASAAITSSDRSAVFLVLDEEYFRQFYRLELVDPQGRIIELGTTVGGVPVHRFQQYNYTIYKVVFPDLALSHTYVGSWDLRLTPNGEFEAGEVETHRKVSVTDVRGFVDASHGVVPVGFAAAVGSSYRMAVDAVASHFQPGATVRMLATLTDRGVPPEDATVTVHVTAPDGTFHPNIGLTPEGGETWSGQFVQTGKAGSYRFLFRSVGKNWRGELVTREDVRFVTLSFPEAQRPEDPCIPCPLLRTILILIVLLLLLILLRCCPRRVIAKTNEPL